MRERKFRAWSKVKNKMYSFQGANYLSGITFSNNSSGETINKVAIHDNDRGVIEWKEADDFVFMEFTGLKDKNGKEIYEGDIIVPDTYHFNDPFVVEYGVQEFADDNYGECSAGWNIPLHYVQEFGDRCPCKVIGNIYENPELLNK